MSSGLDQAGARPVTEASFEVDVGPDETRRFAELSGDWNPLHTDPEYAAATPYGRVVLHGAFSAGLISRLAGMHLPGSDCLLHSMRLRFVAPICPPARLVVSGRAVYDRKDAGRVEALVVDASTATRYVEASYEFGHRAEPGGEEGKNNETTARGGSPDGPPDGPQGSSPDDAESPQLRRALHEQPRVLVTGASGALGSAVLAELGSHAVGLSRGEHAGLTKVDDLERLDLLDWTHPIAAIVHCAWPRPDNGRLTEQPDPRGAVEHHVAAPLRQILALSRVLAERGVDDAPLILVGSTAAEPGRHDYRMPLYTLAKGLIPSLARILALELAPHRRRCLALVYDVVEGGMNEDLSARAQVMHRDRSPFGRIPSPKEAAAQVSWVLDNSSFLLSGATIEVTGGVIP